MADFPPSLPEFQRRFADETACVEYLAAAPWPEGFECPACGGARAWRLSTKPFTRECAGCGKQTSVTAGMSAGQLAATLLALDTEHFPRLVSGNTGMLARPQGRRRREP